MALTLDATVGGAAANSYVTEEEAAAYFETVPGGGSDFTNLSGDEQARALLQAARNIDKLRLHGYRATSQQRLEFPRDLQREPLSQIPRAVREAQCEEALSLARAPRGTTRQRLRAEGVESYRIGDLAETFAGGSGQGTQVSLGARELLGDWIKSSGQILGPGEEPSRGDAIWWGPWTYD